MIEGSGERHAALMLEGGGERHAALILLALVMTLQGNHGGHAWRARRGHQLRWRRRRWWQR